MTLHNSAARSRFRRSGLLALLVTLGLVAFGCGSGSDSTAASGDSSAESGDSSAESGDSTATDSGSTDDNAAEDSSSDETATSSSDETITLAVNPWNGSAVNVAVAKQLIESELGQKVETVEIDENAMWPAINTGEISGALEVWPSGHAQNVADFIDNPEGNIADVGFLGPVGKIGWYIPTYMVDEHPELATWEGFKDPELAKLFATAETGDLGQFLGGDPSFVQYDESIITNLDLPLQVVYAGSEEAILAALDSAYSRQEPILFYLWTPHSAHNKYDLTEVQLPPYTEECYASAPDGGAEIACDYPSDDLFKIVSKDLATSSPEVDEFIEKMNYSTDDQIAMLAMVETDGKTVDEAAAAWIEANPETWNAWLE